MSTEKLQKIHLDRFTREQATNIATYHEISPAAIISCAVHLFVGLPDNDQIEHLIEAGAISLGTISPEEVQVIRELRRRRAEAASDEATP